MVEVHVRVLESLRKVGPTTWWWPRESAQDLPMWPGDLLFWSSRIANQNCKYTAICLADVATDLSMLFSIQWLVVELKVEGNISLGRSPSVCVRPTSASVNRGTWREIVRRAVSTSNTDVDASTWPLCLQQNTTTYIHRYIHTHKYISFKFLSTDTICIIFILVFMLFCKIKWAKVAWK